MANPGKSQAPSGSQFLLKGLGGACMRNRETPAGFKRKGWSIRFQTGCRNSIFETVKSNQNHGKPWQGSSPKRKPIPPQRVLWGMHAKQGNLSRIERKGWSIRPLTGCRNSIFETVKSKAKPWQTVAGFKPQAEANSTSKGSVGHACETGKIQDSSARGGQFVP